MTNINPFIIYGYHSQELFCDREKESEKITTALKNGMNLTLFSLRKIGKTGLIHNVFNRMRKKHRKDGFIYIDISPAEDLKGFIKIFAESIVKQLETKPMSMLKEAALMLKRIRPKMSFDPVSGEPSFSMFFESHSEIEYSLIDSLDYLNKRSVKQDIIIAIDEFQQILNFPEKNVEALLRSKIQFMNNVRFIFSGSSRRMMISIFSDAKRPFYQSTQMMHLEKINPEEYKIFIKSKFNEAGINIETDAIDLILQLTRTHTYYVQYLCNYLYNTKIKTITKNEVYISVTNILLENENIYYGYRTLLPEQQWKVVHAIARENGIEHITSKEFLIKYSLGSHSTVSSAVKSLLSKEIIYEEKDKYYVYDVFFCRWLERL